jgi:hypothetical protein
MGTMKARVEVRHYIILLYVQYLCMQCTYDTVHRSLFNRYADSTVPSGELFFTVHLVYTHVLIKITVVHRCTSLSGNVTREHVL